MDRRVPLIILIVGVILIAGGKTAPLGFILFIVGFVMIQQRGGRRLSAKRTPPHDDWPERRRIVWERDERKCRVCQQAVKLSNCDIHHLTPRSKGGSDEPANLILLCKPCHARMPNHQHLLRQRQYRS